MDKLKTRDGLAKHLPDAAAERSGVDTVIATLRTSVGAFALRRAPFGCYLEIIVGHVRRVLGFYATNEEAVLALRNRRTGFRTWDALQDKTAAMQVRTLKRWEKGAAAR